jgi:hypothetical protein
MAASGKEIGRGRSGGRQHPPVFHAPRRFGGPHVTGRARRPGRTKAMRRAQGDESRRISASMMLSPAAEGRRCFCRVPASSGLAIVPRSARIRMPATATWTLADGVCHVQAHQFVQDGAIGHVVPAQRLERNHLGGGRGHARDGRGHAAQLGRVGEGLVPQIGLGDAHIRHVGASPGPPACALRPSALPRQARMAACGTSSAGLPAPTRRLNAPIEICSWFKLQARSKLGNADRAASLQFAQHQREFGPALRSSDSQPRSRATRIMRVRTAGLSASRAKAR